MDDRDYDPRHEAPFGTSEKLIRALVSVYSESGTLSPKPGPSLNMNLTPVRTESNPHSTNKCNDIDQYATDVDHSSEAKNVVKRGRGRPRGSKSVKKKSIDNSIAAFADFVDIGNFVNNADHSDSETLQRTFLPIIGRGGLIDSLLDGPIAEQNIQDEFEQKVKLAEMLIHQASAEDVPSETITKRLTSDLVSDLKIFYAHSMPFAK